MNRQRHYRLFPDRKELEKLLERDGTSIFNMKNRTVNNFAIALEVLAQHAMIVGAPSHGKSVFLDEFKKA